MFLCRSRKSRSLILMLKWGKTGVWKGVRECVSEVWFMGRVNKAFVNGRTTWRVSKGSYIKMLRNAWCGLLEFPKDFNRFFVPRISEKPYRSSELLWEGRCSHRWADGVKGKETQVSPRGEEPPKASPWQWFKFRLQLDPQPKHESRALQSHMVTPAGLRFTCRWNGVFYKLGLCSVHSWYPLFLLSDHSRELSWLQLLFLSDIFSEPTTVHLKSGFVLPLCVTSHLSVLNSIFHSVTLSVLCISSCLICCSFSPLQGEKWNPWPYASSQGSHERGFFHTSTNPIPSLCWRVLSSRFSSYESHSRPSITLLSSPCTRVWDEGFETTAWLNQWFIQQQNCTSHWSDNLPFSRSSSLRLHAVCYRHRWPIWQFRYRLTNGLPPPLLSSGVLLSQWLTGVLLSQTCLVIASPWFTAQPQLFLPGIQREMCHLPLLALVIS